MEHRKKRVAGSRCFQWLTCFCVCLNLLSFSATDLLLSKFKLSQDKESGDAVVSPEWPPGGESVQPAQWGSLTVCCVQMTFTQLIDVHIIRQAVLMICKAFLRTSVSWVYSIQQCVYGRKLPPPCPSPFSFWKQYQNVMVFSLTFHFKHPSSLVQVFREKHISFGIQKERNVAILKIKHPHKLWPVMWQNATLQSMHWCTQCWSLKAKQIKYIYGKMVDASTKYVMSKW